MLSHTRNTEFGCKSVTCMHTLELFFFSFALIQMHTMLHDCGREHENSPQKMIVV
jgi:hypothetical protein